MPPQYISIAHSSTNSANGLLPYKHSHGRRHGDVVNVVATIASKRQHFCSLRLPLPIHSILGGFGVLREVRGRRGQFRNQFLAFGLATKGRNGLHQVFHICSRSIARVNDRLEALLRPSWRSPKPLSFGQAYPASTEHVLTGQLKD